ncbi:MAG: cytochrome c [Acidobacteriota bacterium]|nr:cytochrome c [Acidobacteriota bacterium]
MRRRRGDGETKPRGCRGPRAVAPSLRLPVFFVVCVALFAPACSPRQEKTARAADPTRELFQRNCAVCHGEQGEGRQLGTLNVPSLRTGRAATDPDERLLAQIQNGGNGMPPFKYSLTDEQIQDLLRFVREGLQGRAASKQ